MKSLFLTIFLIYCLISSTNCAGIAGSSYTLHNNALKYGIDNLMRQLFPDFQMYINHNEAVESRDLSIFFAHYINYEELNYSIIHSIEDDQFKFTLNDNQFTVFGLIQNFETFDIQSITFEINFSIDIYFYLHETGKIQIKDFTSNNFNFVSHNDIEHNLSDTMKQVVLNATKQSVTNQFQGKVNSINNQLSDLPLEILLSNINVLLNLSFNQESAQIQNTLFQNMFGMENSQWKGIPSYTNSIEFPPQNSEKDVVFLLSEYTLNTISSILLNDQKLVGSINQINFPEQFSEGLKYFLQVGCNFSSTIKLESAPTFEIINSQIIIHADNLTIDTYASSSCGQPALINKIQSSVRFIAQATLVDNKSIKLTITEGSLQNFVQLQNYMNYVDAYYIQNLIQSTINENISRINSALFSDTIPFNMNQYNLQEATLSLIDHFIRAEANLQR